MPKHNDDNLIYFPLSEGKGAHSFLESESGEGKTGSGGNNGEIEFRFNFSTGETRDDLLSSAELKRLVAAHNETHKGRVDKQKNLREERAAQKAGRMVTPSERSALGLASGIGGRGGARPYKQHPISQLAQFSGIDTQVNVLPTLNEADTNPELRDALELRYQHTFTPNNAPKFRPPGS